MNMLEINENLVPNRKQNKTEQCTDRCKLMLVACKEIIRLENLCPSAIFHKFPAQVSDNDNDVGVLFTSHSASQKAQM